MAILAWQRSVEPLMSIYLCINWIDTPTVRVIFTSICWLKTKQTCLCQSLIRCVGEKSRVSLAGKSWEISKRCISFYRPKDAHYPLKAKLVPKKTSHIELTLPSKTKSLERSCATVIGTDLPVDFYLFFSFHNADLECLRDMLTPVRMAYLHKLRVGRCVEIMEMIFCHVCSI